MSTDRSRRERTVGYLDVRVASSCYLLYRPGSPRVAEKSVMETFFGGKRRKTGTHLKPSVTKQNGPYWPPQGSSLRFDLNQ